MKKIFFLGLFVLSSHSFASNLRLSYSESKNLYESLTTRAQEEKEKGTYSRISFRKEGENFSCLKTVWLYHDGIDPVTYECDVNLSLSSKSLYGKLNLKAAPGEIVSNSTIMIMKKKIGKLSVIETLERTSNGGTRAVYSAEYRQESRRQSPQPARKPRPISLEQPR